MSKRRTFVERVLAGEIWNVDNKIDDEIDAWHESADPESECELYEWLGLTEREYALFVEKPNTLRAILNVRRTGADVFQVLAMNDNAFALAARGADANEADQIVSWLKQTGRL